MNERIKKLAGLWTMSINERIQKLAEQQGLTGPNYFLSSQELEKFAELIVRECADIASINQHQYEPTGLYVLKHFGVED